MDIKYQYSRSVINANIVVYKLSDDGRQLSHRDVYRLWREDPDFVRFYVRLMLDTSCDGFCWETPPVVLENLGDEHEFAVIRSEAHARLRQNWTPFSEHFRNGNLAVSFLNLGKNGIMIAPQPDRSFDGGSIASFLKTASDERVIALWQLVGKEMIKRVNNVPIWLSTAGLGVSWLHVRLDSKPKYYRYSTYKQLG